MPNNAIVEMNEQGRITLPAKIRKLLHLEENAQFEVIADGMEIRLRPMVTIPREDLWAYTPEHVARVRQARVEIRDGQVVEMSEDDVQSRL